MRVIGILRLIERDCDEFKLSRMRAKVLTASSVVQICFEGGHLVMTAGEGGMCSWRTGETSLNYVTSIGNANSKMN